MARYEIFLKNESSGGGARRAVAGETSSSSGQKKKTVDADQLIKNFVSFKTVEAFVKQGIQHEISTVELRTGSAELQQRIEFGYETAMGAIGSLIGGAMVGGVPGAVIGGVLYVAGKALNAAYKADTIKLKQMEEGISLGMMDTRAGGFSPTYSQSRGGRQ